MHHCQSEGSEHRAVTRNTLSRKKEYNLGGRRPTRRRRKKSGGLGGAAPQLAEGHSVADTPGVWGVEPLRASQTTPRGGRRRHSLAEQGVEGDRVPPRGRGQSPSRRGRRRKVSPHFYPNVAQKHQ